MQTDPMVIRRVAAELDVRFRGARVNDVGMLPDRRVAVSLWSRGVAHLLAFDIFGTPPLITVESGELEIAVEPGFIRALGAVLRGMAVLGVNARVGDRLLRMTFGTRSRFGIGDEVQLYVELAPRFGNIILVKNDSIVAAAKEFSPAQNRVRSVQVGMAYQLPPLPPERPIHSSIDAESSVLDAMRAARDEHLGSGERERTSARRHAQIKRLQDRKRSIDAELRDLATKRDRASARDTLRVEGECIYATLYELDAPVADEAKKRATELFAEYRKLGLSLPHLDERERTLQKRHQSIDALLWEVERASDEDLSDVEAAINSFEHHPSSAVPAMRKRKRARLEVRTASGSRILIGRSPSENADLTFRIARPGDVWFHTREIPGAHVILQRDDRSEPPNEDILVAASLAAFHSKAKSSAKVAVDYTHRKHVRKQKDAPPGLVWYTDFQTVNVAPTPGEG